MGKGIATLLAMVMFWSYLIGGRGRCFFSFLMGIFSPQFCSLVTQSFHVKKKERGVTTRVTELGKPGSQTDDWKADNKMKVRLLTHSP